MSGTPIRFFSKFNFLIVNYPPYPTGVQAVHSLRKELYLRFNTKKNLLGALALAPGL